MNRPFACALLVLFSPACSSSNSDSGAGKPSDAGAGRDSSTASRDDAATGSVSTSALDGTWSFTMPTTLLGADIRGGTMVAGNGMYALTFVGSDMGQPTGESDDGGAIDCVVSKDQTVVAVQITKGTLTGTATQETQLTGSACSSTAENDFVLYDISATQLTVATPTLTPYDGAWSVKLADQTGLQMDISFPVTIAGGSWTAAAPFAASGTVESGMATATSIGGTSADFAAVRQ